MATKKQLLNNLRQNIIRVNRRKALEGCPQKKAVCTKVYTLSPRKPNSAKRKVTRLMIPKTQVGLTAFIPGVGHNLQKFSNVLVCGGGAHDLPGGNLYETIRGKFDLKGVNLRRSSRSKYGIKKSEKK